MPAAAVSSDIDTGKRDIESSEYPVGEDKPVRPATVRVAPNNLAPIVNSRSTRASGAWEIDAMESRSVFEKTVYTPVLASGIGADNLTAIIDTKCLRVGGTWKGNIDRGVLVSFTKKSVGARIVVPVEADNLYAAVDSSRKSSKRRETRKVNRRKHTPLQDKTLTIPKSCRRVRSHNVAPNINPSSPTCPFGVRGCARRAGGALSMLFEHNTRDA